MFHRLVYILILLNNSARTIEDCLGSVLERVPRLRPEKGLAPGFPGLAFQVGKTKLLLEYQSIVQPNDIPRLIHRLQEHLSAQTEPAYGVVAADFLSETSIERLWNAGLGALDRSGNCRLAFGSTYIEQSGRPNLFRSVKESKSLFAPKAQRILRVLLSPPLRPWSGTQLAQACDVSPGLVTIIRKALLDRELAVGNWSSIYIQDPRKVLREWASVDRWVARTRVLEFSSIFPKQEILQVLYEQYGNKQLAFTQWTAANLRRPATESGIISAYVSEEPTENFVKTALFGRPVDRNGNIRLILPKDPGVFLAVQTVHRLPLVCDPQIWLDLQGAGNRAEEQATELWNWDEFGGWNS
jgi:hypothetical protein